MFSEGLVKRLPVEQIARAWREPANRHRLTQKKKNCGMLMRDAAVFDLDENGFVTYWSEKAEQVYGYDRESMVGKHIASLYLAADLLHHKPAHELKAAAFHSPYFTFAWQKNKDGREFWAYSEYQVIRDGSGGLLGFRKSIVEAPILMSDSGR